MVANTRNRSGRARAGKSLLLQDSSAEDLYVSRSQGSLLFDERGRRYIDFTMGWCVGNLGWGRREIAEAIRSFDGPDYVSPTLKYRPWEELARMLSEIAPGKLRGGTCVRG